jgi:hypothetical protein
MVLRTRGDPCETQGQWPSMVESAVMILHGLRAGSPVVTDPGCRLSAARGATLAPLGEGRDSDQAFLDDRGNEAAVTPEDLAARQPTCPGCGWGLLEVQQPASARNGAWNHIA